MSAPNDASLARQSLTARHSKQSVTTPRLMPVSFRRTVISTAGSWNLVDRNLASRGQNGSGVADVSASSLCLSALLGLLGLPSSHDDLAHKLGPTPQLMVVLRYLRSRGLKAWSVWVKP
jgi:hypothetical protein